MNNPAGGSRETIILDLDEGEVERRDVNTWGYSLPRPSGLMFPFEDSEDFWIEDNQVIFGEPNLALFFIPLHLFIPQIIIEPLLCRVISDELKIQE